MTKHQILTAYKWLRETYPTQRIFFRDIRNAVKLLNL